MGEYTLGQLAFVLTGPSMLRHGGNSDGGLCPSSWKHIFNYERFDLTLCYVELLPCLPLAILLVFGSIEAWSLRKLPVKRLSGWRGLGLYRLKLVSARLHFAFDNWLNALPRPWSQSSQPYSFQPSSRF